ncbi:MAG: hypothetical protein O3B01_30420, partial [Planctomycetota bacterium]|nr:hypothetical protein [Planctomycetota bacterium]
MPIEIGARIRSMSLDEFKKIDHRVMGLSYDIHNQLGRLCEKKSYQNELLYRCRASGMPAEKEVPVTLTFRNFTKTVYIDRELPARVHEGLKAVRLSSEIYTLEDSYGQERLSDT